jgi:hypothetical protein
MKPRRVVTDSLGHMEPNKKQAHGAVFPKFTSGDTNCFAGLGPGFWLAELCRAVMEGLP